MQVLLPLVRPDAQATTTQAPPLQGAVRAVGRVVGRLPSATLSAILPALLPGLFKVSLAGEDAHGHPTPLAPLAPALVSLCAQAFNHPSADVRKAVVFCLVDMYLVLGEALTPHLQALSTAQLKLVTIYITRTLKARQGQ